MSERHDPKRYVRALEDEWRLVLDVVARERGFACSEEVSRVGKLVARLSALYNDRGARAPGADDRDALAARLLFSFARDVPKGAGAVRELAQAGLLSRSRPLRVLDVGAGMGAMTWGIVRAIEAFRASAVAHENVAHENVVQTSAGPGENEILVDADLVDHHQGALDIAAAIARTRGGAVRVRTRIGAATDARAGGRPGEYDVVILGQVLSELDRDASDGERALTHAALLRRWMDQVRPDGALVVVEPALRDRTRHLHRVREAILRGPQANAPAVNVFAPCLHQSACPMLVREHDWCHEDLPVDLPEWLVPIARAAGLRWEGLTFSYLVLRRDGLSLGELARDAAPRTHPRSLLRDVSGVLRTKGKTERIMCGVTDGLEEGGGLRPMRLDRAETEANAGWDDASRGDVLAFSPPLVANRPRVEAQTEVSPAAIERREAVDATRGRR